MNIAVTETASVYQVQFGERTPFRIPKTGIVGGFCLVAQTLCRAYIEQGEALERANACIRPANEALTKATVRIEALRIDLAASRAYADGLAAQLAVGCLPKDVENLHAANAALAVELSAARATIAGMVEKIINLANCQIPYYAYGDNQAACEMASRLNDIAQIASLASAKEPSPSTSYANGWMCQCKLEGASVIHPTGTYCVGCNTYAPHCAPSTPEPYRNPWGGGDFGERLEDAMPSPPEQSAARMADGVREVWTRDVERNADDDTMDDVKLAWVNGRVLSVSGIPIGPREGGLKFDLPVEHYRIIPQQHTAENSAQSAE